MMLALALALLTMGTPDDVAESEVMLIGVWHAPGQFLSESMSPGHVRSALIAFAPDVVCVESEPSWFEYGRFYRQTYEAQKIAVPYAYSLGLPVFGIDWLGDSSGHRAEIERVERVRLEKAVLLGERPLQAAAPFRFGPSHESEMAPLRLNPDNDFLHLNSDAYAEERIQWLDSGKANPGTAQHYIAERDARIADHIREVLEQHPRQKIAVVIGAAHVGNLRRELAKDCRVRAVGELEVDFADARKMEESLTVQDIAAILIHVLDRLDGYAFGAQRRDRLLRLFAEKVRSDPSGREHQWWLYVQARMAMLEGRDDEARVEFERLLSLGTGTSFPFEGTNYRHYLDLRQVALLELGRLAERGGDREGAVRHYGVLRESISVPVFSEDYHSDYSFAARASNAIQALLTHPYKEVVAMTEEKSLEDPRGAKPQRKGAPRASAGKELRKLWELHRARQWEEIPRIAKAVLHTVGVAPIERNEALFHLTAATYHLGEHEEAKERLTELEAGIQALGPDHWLRKETGKLAVLIRD